MENKEEWSWVLRLLVSRRWRFVGLWDRIPNMTVDVIEEVLDRTARIMNDDVTDLGRVIDAAALIERY